MRALLYLSLLILFTRCTDDSQETEIVDMDEVVPTAKGDYNYEKNDSVNIEVKKDPFISSLSSQLQMEVEELSSLEKKDDWRYSPDRLKNDSSITKWMMIDSTEYIYKYWGYEDSLLSINAFYNWMDCFGSNCTSISIGDSVNVSNEGFLLLQSNRTIHFIKSNEIIQVNRWKKILNKDHKKTSWNYVIRQRPGGTMDWMIIPN